MGGEALLESGCRVRQKRYCTIVYGSKVMGLVLNRVKLHRMLAMNVFCGPFFDCAGYKKRDLCALLVMLFCMLLGPLRT